MTTVAEIEALFLAARDARDAADVAAVRGIPADADARGALAAEAETAEGEVVRALTDGSAGGSATGEDATALGHMRRRLAAGIRLDAVSIDRDPDEVTAGIAAATSRLAEAFAVAAESLVLDGAPIGRLSVLGRLRTEPDAATRRRLFLALEPLWRAVDGDGDGGSPYRDLLRSFDQAGIPGPAVATAAAVGIEVAELERWCVAILGGWRDATGSTAMEPWDWLWRAAAADRAVGAAVPADRLLEIDRAYHRSLGADLERLGIEFDVVPRSGRPPVAVAFTTFGRRSPVRAVVLATYREGGLAELTELVHETGHAIHISAITTRPAYLDWPDSDAFVEAVADILAIDTVDPLWLARWVDRSLGELPVGLLARSRLADVALDAAWALFELRLQATPSARPNDVWTDITSRYLGIAPHPEWSWWAIRGQLASSPGYMANYAVGAILAADLRGTIRAARGDWTAGDPGWYGWVSERLYRFGASRPAADVIRELLGRDPSPRALLVEIAGLAGLAW